MGLVQTKQGSTSGSNPALTVTLDGATGSGNSLIVAVSMSGVSTDAHVSGITLGGSADNFAQRKSQGTGTDPAIAELWDDQSCAGGQTSVVISVTGGSNPNAVLATVYEFDDLTASAFDQSAGQLNGSNTTSWDSTATATTAQANEVFIGAVFCINTGGSSSTITGPGSGWANLGQVSQAFSTFTGCHLSGWQWVGATGTAQYNGTVSPSDVYTAVVGTWKTTDAPVSTFAHDAETLGPAGTDNTTTGSYTTTGAQTALSHAASASARAAVVCVTQTGSAADQVSGVTYGGAAMTRLRFDSESTEAGATYIYWLDNIATGTQNVVLTTSGSNIKKLVVSTMTASPGASVAVAGHNTGTSASASNPSWTITGLTASSKLEAYECIHSGLQTMTTTPAASWTRQESLDEGATGRGFARQEVASSGTSLTCGWTAATADDFVGSSAAFIEVAGATVTGDVALTETATITATAARAVPAAAAVSTAATITAAGTGTRLAAGAVAATAAITATGARTVSAAAAVATTATITATAARTVPATAAVAATATITASATVGTAPISADAAQTGTATITAAGTSTLLGAAAVAETATITASGTGTRLASAAVAGTATIAATGTGIRQAAAAAAETATITAAGTSTRLAAAAVSTAATITATATVGTAPISADAAFTETATITATGTGTRQAAAAVAETATITAAGTGTRLGAAAVAETATITAAGTSTVRGAAAVATAVTITADLFVPLPFTVGALTAADAPGATLTASGAPAAVLATVTATGPAAAYTAAYAATYAGAQPAPALSASSAPVAALTASDARTGGPA